MELLVEDYFYDLAFNDIKCKEYCSILEKFLLEQVKDENNQNYMRLIPVAVHILTLNGNITEAVRIRSELTSTVAASMWDLYNHQDYEKADKIAEELLDMDKANVEARFLQKENREKEAIELLENQSLVEGKQSQILFRKGRAFDQIGDEQEAMKCYLKALEYNSKAYDAKLCLLNRQIIENPQSAEKEIKNLKGELRGKRKFILSNIEARFIGYYNHDEDKAIDILEGVPQRFRDRQWYAVKKQLLENIILKHKQAHRMILVKEYENEFFYSLLDTSRLLFDARAGSREFWIFQEMQSR